MKNSIISHCVIQPSFSSCASSTNDSTSTKRCSSWVLSSPRAQTHQHLSPVPRKKIQFPKTETRLMTCWLFCRLVVSGVWLDFAAPCVLSSSLHSVCVLSVNFRFSVCCCLSSFGFVSYGRGRPLPSFSLRFRLLCWCFLSLILVVLFVFIWYAIFEIATGKKR